MDQQTRSFPADLGTPEARQLLHSLQAYAASDAFHPKHQIALKLLRKLFP